MTQPCSGGKAPKCAKRVAIDLNIETGLCKPCYDLAFREAKKTFKLVRKPPVAIQIVNHQSAAAEALARQTFALL
jgi:hypothetical protein